MNWEYLQPVKIWFGDGSRKRIREAAKAIGCKNGLLVSDPFFLSSGLAEQLLSESGGVLTGIYGEVSPNPDVKEVDTCAAIIRKNKHGFVVALGGGSALDCAKAAASICMTEDSIRKYHGTGVAMPQEHLPLIAIPTTAGTGSEVTCVSVLTNHAEGEKSPIVSDGFYPTLALIDPELTYSMPPGVTASTGIDVLCHALEGFWSKGHQPVCDALARHACRLVFTYLERACMNGSDKEAREKMAEASLIAGMAFTLPKTTASHACSFPLTNLYHIPHGEACGLTIDYFAKINAEAESRRLESFADDLGFDGVEGIAEKIRSLKMKLGLRTDLKDLNLTQEQIEELIRISRHPNLYNNPVEITDDMLREMYYRMACGS